MKLNEAAKKRVQIYVDMDGVIANFVGGIKQGLVPDYDEDKYMNDPKYREDMWDKVAEYSEKGGKMWLELPVMGDAMELWNFLKPHKPQILSATGRRAYGASAQKKEWIKKHIDQKVKVNLVTAARMKAQYAKKGDILIDDQPKAINPWKAAGGVGILHTNAKDTIAQLKKLGY